MRSPDRAKPDQEECIISHYIILTQCNKGPWGLRRKTELKTILPANSQSAATMAPSYLEALDLITAEAERAKPSSYETVSLLNALNRTPVCTYRSPISTPQFDTSAMDGYALNSKATSTACPEKPVVFHVKGVMAAGDEPLHLSSAPEVGPGLDTDSPTTVFPCVEIMTGARFPQSIEGSEELDCCVKWEDVTVLEKKNGCIAGNHYIQVTKPVQSQQNKRLAGGDFSKGDVIVSLGETIRPGHIMALASVGVGEVEITRKPKIGVFSTGTELLSPDTQRPGGHRIQDANGPYTTAFLRDTGAEVDFLGVLDDGIDTMIQSLNHHLHEQIYDIIISTGAVSTGKFDLIPAALQRLNSRIIFHNIAIRPGHAALFAKIPRPAVETDAIVTETAPETAFFGLPGNPVASAACLRFLVVPYLQRLENQTLASPLRAIVHYDLSQKKAVKFDDATKADQGVSLISKFPIEKDVFRPGLFDRRSSGEIDVMLINDHSPGKIKPFLASNCWIHIPKGVSQLHAGDTVNIISNE